MNDAHSGSLADMTGYLDSRAAIVKGHGMPQAPACFASEEGVSENVPDDEGARTEPSRRVQKSQTASLVHLRGLQAALRRVDSHIRTTAVQEPAHGSLSEHCCISHQPALPRIPARLTPFRQSSGTNVVGDWGAPGPGDPSMILKGR